jgi:hypothetical protein
MLPDKVTPEMMSARIIKADYIYPFGTTLTICILHLDNGFTVTGEAACVDPANFDAELGQKYSHKDAFEKLWPLFGFLLAEDQKNGHYAHVRGVQVAPSRNAVYYSPSCWPRIASEGIAMLTNPAFKPFRSKPVTRYAYQIAEDDTITQIDESSFYIPLHDEMVGFKAYEQPVAGDYIVWLKTEIYHCSRDVFHERNLVED